MLRMVGFGDNAGSGFFYTNDEVAFSKYLDKLEQKYTVEKVLHNLININQSRTIQESGRKCVRFLDELLISKKADAISILQNGE